MANQIHIAPDPHDVALAEFIGNSLAGATGPTFEIMMTDVWRLTLKAVPGNTQGILLSNGTTIGFDSTGANPDNTPAGTYWVSTAGSPSVATVVSRIVTKVNATAALGLRAIAGPTAFSIYFKKTTAGTFTMASVNDSSNTTFDLQQIEDCSKITLDIIGVYVGVGANQETRFGRATAAATGGTPTAPTDPVMMEDDKTGAPSNATVFPAVIQGYSAVPTKAASEKPVGSIRTLASDEQYFDYMNLVGMPLQLIGPNSRFVVTPVTAAVASNICVFFRKRR